MPPEQMDHLVDEHLSAEARADIPAVLDTLDEGILRNIPGAAEMLAGKDASQAFHSALFAEMEITGYRNLRRGHGPDFLVDLMLVEAKATGNPFGFEGPGPALRVLPAARLRVRQRAHQPGKRLA